MNIQVLNDDDGIYKYPSDNHTMLFGWRIFQTSYIKKKKRFKYIPVIVGGIGGALGLTIYYISPELLLNITNPLWQLP